MFFWRSFVLLLLRWVVDWLLLLLLLLLRHLEFWNDYMSLFYFFVFQFYVNNAPLEGGDDIVFTKIFDDGWMERWVNGYVWMDG